MVCVHMRSYRPGSAFFLVLRAHANLKASLVLLDLIRTSIVIMHQKIDPWHAIEPCLHECEVPTCQHFRRCRGEGGRQFPFLKFPPAIFSLEEIAIE